MEERKLKVVQLAVSCTITLLKQQSKHWQEGHKKRARRNKKLNAATAPCFPWKIYDEVACLLFSVELDTFLLFLATKDKKNIKDNAYVTANELFVFVILVQAPFTHLVHGKYTDW